MMSRRADTILSDPNPSEEECLHRTYTLACRSACSQDNNYRIEADKDIGRQSKGKICCQLTRCQKCYRDVGINQCGENIASSLLDMMTELSREISRNNCTSTERFPSFKCLYIFYTVWFFVFPSNLLVVLAIIVYNMRRHHRRRVRRGRTSRVRQNEIMTAIRDERTR